MHNNAVTFPRISIRIEPPYRTCLYHSVPVYRVKNSSSEDFHAPLADGHASASPCNLRVDTLLLCEHRFFAAARTYMLHTQGRPLGTPLLFSIPQSVRVYFLPLLLFFSFFYTRFFQFLSSERSFDRCDMINNHATARNFNGSRETFEVLIFRGIRFFKVI